VLRFRAGVVEVAVALSPAAVQRVLVADAERYGEGMWTRRRRRVLGDCLITREGAPHRERRAALQPSFERRRLAALAPATVGRARAAAPAWRERGDAGAGLGRLALAISADTLLALDLEPQAGELVPALTTLAAIPDAWPSWRARRRVAAARRAVDGVLDPAIAARRAHPAGGDGDVLSALVAGLDDRAVRDEVVALLIAGTATVARALGHARDLLARHPAVAARVEAELDAVLAGRAPELDDLPRLAELDRVLREVLRLHPSVGFVDRRPLADVELEGHRVPAGALVLASPLLTHRDPRLYDEPDAFRPERWAAADLPARPRYAYFPFGGGPHACIGRAQARMQLPLALATLMTAGRRE
jgi:cytochrome P450